MAQKDYGSAAETYRSILRAEPQNPLAHAGLGSALLSQKDRTGAKEHYQKALQLDPKCLAAMTGLGSVALEDDQPVLAKKWYRKVIRINPKISGAYYGLALACKQLGEYQETIRHADRFLEMAPHSNLTAIVKKIRARARNMIAGVGR
jgi:tetratricopeptide (TPR) repeat protein